MFSDRSGTGAPPNRLTRAIERARRSGAALLDLTASNPTLAGIPYAPEVVAVLSNGAALRYDPAPFGLASARQAVARSWRERGHEVDPARIVLTASTSEAYAYLFKLLCDPGDEVLIPTPSYPLFESLARYEGVRLRPYPLRYDGSWHVDLGEILARAGGCRAVLVVNPNNPTGSFVKRDELRALCSLGVPIISDEVFSSYPLREDGDRVESLLGAEGAPLVLVLDGLSKLAALPQMKLGWITVSGEEPRVTEALSRLEHIADAFLSVSTPSQLALPTWLSTRARAHAAVLERLARNLAALRAALDGSAATVYPVEGGWYAVVRLPAVLTEDDWVVALVEERSVIVHPGHFFDFDDEPYAVLGLLAEPGVFDAGIRRLADHVEACAASPPPR